MYENGYPISPTTTFRPRKVLSSERDTIPRRRALSVPEISDFNPLYMISSSKPTLNTQNRIKKSRSLSGLSPSSRTSKACRDAGSSPKEAFTNEVTFGAWQNAMKQELFHASQEKHRLYLDQLRQTDAHLQSLLQSANGTLGLLSSLSKSFDAVETQTSEFRAQCEEILADQTRTEKLAVEIAENIQYYAFLEPITKRLNAPGAGGTVRRHDFSEMLSTLDQCLDYMQEHPEQREASAYGSKYRLLLTRALTLIRNHFTASIRDISSDVSKRLTDRQLSDSSRSTLLYAKFRVGAPDLKRVGSELEKRANFSSGAPAGAEGEYQGLMSELYSAYSTARIKLLSPLVHNKMTEIAAAPNNAKELLPFARSAISFIRSLCLDEYELWNEWFTTETSLYTFLEALCEPLYDHLRPRTIHEVKILKLCELCMLIQTQYGEDEDSSEESAEDSPRLDFARLIGPALQDAQDRLVFLAQVVLRNDIQNFKPKPDDLDYPRKASKVALSGTRNLPTLHARKDSNGLASPAPKTPMIAEEDGVDRDYLFDGGMQGLYPTLRKSIWLLGRIYRLVHSSVFTSLAHDILHSTTLSLESAAAQITPRVSPTDANLFLLSNLLALKQHILAFDIEYAPTDVHLDLGAPLRDLRAGLFNPVKLIRALGSGLVPRVVTDMTDARDEVDARLRGVIKDLVTGWASRMTAALNYFPDRQDEPRGRRASKVQQSRSSDAAAAARVRDDILRELPLVRKKIEEYIHDHRTRDMLLRAVLQEVLVRYAGWIEYLGYATGSEPGRIPKGKGREDGVWEGDVFGEWAVGVFGVGEVVENDGEEE